MREAVRRLAQRCSVCVVSGRDRPVVQQLMGLDDLIVAGSHGFDIWSPAGGDDPAPRGRRGFEALLEAVTDELREPGRLGAAARSMESKASSVAVHYRLVDEADRPRIKAIVDELLAEHADDAEGDARQDGLRDPAEARLGQGQGGAAPARRRWGSTATTSSPLYVGDDITDEDAFATLAGRGIGILVGRPRRSGGRRGGRTPRRVRRPRPRRGPRPARRCWPRWSARRSLGARVRRLRPRRGGAARSADVDRQRLLLHARRGRVGGRGRRALPGHVRPRRLQPRDDDHGRPARCPTRTSSTCPNCARAQAAGRGRGAVLARERRAARLPPRVRHPQRGRPAPSCASAIAPAARRR